MSSNKIHLEFTEVQYNQLMNALCYARLYLKALIMYEQREFGGTDKLNELIYEDTLSNYSVIYKSNAVKSSRRKEID